MLHLILELNEEFLQRTPPVPVRQNIHPGNVDLWGRVASAALHMWAGGGRGGKRRGHGVVGGGGCAVHHPVLLVDASQVDLGLEFHDGGAVRVLLPATDEQGDDPAVEGSLGQGMSP